MFEDFWGNFWGNRHVTDALEQMIAQDRLSQTLLFSGPEGVGKATLARRLGAHLLGHGEKIERDDLSFPQNMEIVAEREKWTSDKRNDDPLLFSSHPDFVTFAPDGPLRQITIQQARLIKERAPFLPHHGSRRIFLIDRVDRANDQAANSLLKTLEEPPPHLILIMTAENAYDLLPTIRSRAVPFQFAPLGQEEMREFVRARALDEPERRMALAAGSPGVAVSLDLEVYDRRRSAMLMLLQVAAGAAPFANWIPVSDSMGRSKSDKLDFARFDAFARGHGRDPESGYSTRSGSARRKDSVRVDSESGRAGGRDRAVDPAQYSEEHRARCAHSGIANELRQSAASPQAFSDQLSAVGFG
jgi:DNA polymerase III subunit delta'